MSVFGVKYADVYDQTSLLKSSENVDNQSYYIVGCSLTAHRKTNVFRNFGSKCEVTTTRPRQILQKKWYIIIEREKNKLAN